MTQGLKFFADYAEWVKYGGREAERITDVLRGLRCRVSRTSDGDRIEVAGKLTQRSRKRVIDLLWSSAADGRPVTLDLAGVTYFDGNSVLVLIGNKQILERQRGCQVDLTGLETATRRILALT